MRAAVNGTEVRHDVHIRAACQQLRLGVPRERVIFAGKRVDAITKSLKTRVGAMLFRVPLIERRDCRSESALFQELLDRAFGGSHVAMMLASNG